MEGHRARLSTGADSDVAAVLPVLGGFAAADDPYRLLLGVAGHFGRRNQNRAATVRHHAAFQQMQRIGNGPRVQNVFDVNLVYANKLQVGHSFDRLGVAHGVAAGCHRYGGKLLVGRAVLEPMAHFHHGIVADEGETPRVFHVLEEVGWSSARGAGGPDGPPVRMGRGAVGD